MNVSAYHYDVDINFIEPSIPDIGGYAVVYGDYGYGYAPVVFYVAFYPYNFDYEFNGDATYDTSFDFARFRLNVTDTSFTITLGLIDNLPGYEYGGYLICYRLASDGDVVDVASKYIDSSETSWSYSMNFDNIRSWQPVGNFAGISNTLTEYHSMDVLWGTDLRFYNLLQSNYQIITNIYSRLGSIGSDVSDIKNALTQGDSNGSISDVSKNDISNVTNKESQILNTSNIDTSSLNVQLNSNVMSSTMTLVDSLVTGNAKIATMAFTLMTLAVVAFVLRR